ncbi:hypothetical protein [Lusitaniella coriacea]|uniref:hypothetical protein n=1 Tax=Lusitaniella coriacea TaxID=1983105 RepID=UPI001E3BA023|nr:hypothetical protein [Lusitaniella coriacea]
MTEKNSQRLRGTTPEIDQAALKLRHQPTPAESRLWQTLRSKKTQWFAFPSPASSR